MNVGSNRIEWICRLVFAAVFVLNISCALSFIIWPGDFMGAYELSGTSGIAAVQGIGVAFLMWNVTYPLFILKPRKHVSLGWIIVAQQLVGCLGEVYVFACIGAEHEMLKSSIIRFLEFDVAGLVLMLASLLLMILSTKDRDDIR